MKRLHPSKNKSLKTLYQLVTGDSFKKGAMKL